jgi:hypothetical protein
MPGDCGRLPGELPKQSMGASGNCNGFERIAAEEAPTRLSKRPLFFKMKR